MQLSSSLALCHYYSYNCNLNMAKNVKIGPYRYIKFFLKQNSLLDFDFILYQLPNFSRLSCQIVRLLCC